MNKVIQIQFELRGISNTIEAEYKSNESVSESGFDALNLPFDPNICIGYPTLHAYIKNMVNTGYRRSCGWIQLIKREYFSSALIDIPDEIEICVDTNDPVSIFFAQGYPAEIYDAPCNNLNGNVKGTWTAYTYLVDIPSRMNGYNLAFLAGFKWGYDESCIDNKLLVSMHDIKEISVKQWDEHIPIMDKQYPQYTYSK